MKMFKYILAVMLFAGSAQAADMDFAEDFNGIDKNGDGYITVEELLVYQKDGLNEQNIQVFKVIDTNGDGEITEEEFIVFYKSNGLNQTDADKDLKNRFAKIDTDGNKKITSEEMAEFRNKTLEADNKELFDSMDTDGDGKVDEKDFKQFFELIQAISRMQ